MHCLEQDMNVIPLISVGAAPGDACPAIDVVDLTSDKHLTLDAVAGSKVCWNGYHCCASVDASAAVAVALEGKVGRGSCRQDTYVCSFFGLHCDRSHF